MISNHRRMFLWTVRGSMWLAIALTGLLTLFIVGYVLLRGVPNITWELLSTSPSYLSNRIGILLDILNTLYIILAALVIVIPLGVGAAVYLTKYASNRRLVGIIEYASEALSGIPSIIYGLVGMLVFSNNMGTSLLAGALTLVIMNLPTILRNTQESLKTVPQSYREGAFGLGAGKWRVIRTVVLPGCVDGVVTGCILSVGRIQTQALTDWDESLGKRIKLVGSGIDEKERILEAICMKLLLRQQPVAKDLHAISAALKMITDLERIGDQGEDIAEIIPHMDSQGREAYPAIQEMARQAMTMVTDSVEAYVRRDAALARSVIDHDDIVDAYFLQI